MKKRPFKEQIRLTIKSAQCPICGRTRTEDVEAPATSLLRYSCGVGHTWTVNQDDIDHEYEPIPRFEREDIV